MDTPRIVGICLVKNEDLHIERVIQNTLDFCDDIIVLDNRSEDGTAGILQKISQSSSKILLHSIENPMRSHAFVEPYANTNTWVFKIDADEIYDPVGLRSFRKEILAGKYEKYWRLHGPALNCITLDIQYYTASGYLSPPSKFIPILYNFNAIFSWHEPYGERLHGNNVLYKPGYNYFSHLMVDELHSWEDSLFRCLHLAFIKRSSLDKKYTSRLNPQETSSVPRKLLNLFRNLHSGRITFESNYKKKQYTKGNLVKKDISAFFPLSRQATTQK